MARQVGARAHTHTHTYIHIGPVCPKGFSVKQVCTERIQMIHFQFQYALLQKKKKKKKKKKGVKIG
jgi:hypothetical protein